MRSSLALSFTALLIAAPVSATAGTITQLTHQPPDGAIITMLMTDGTLMAQGYGQSDWWKLTPDNKGSYVNGTWTQVASLESGYAPYANAESVLADGRLVIAGGEYNGGGFSFTNESEIYDPLTNKWTDITPDRRLLAFIGDSPSTVLPDGRFILGEKVKKKVFAFDPKTMTWSELPSIHKNDFNAEEGWTLLPDGSILTFDVKAHPKSERYLPDTGEWIGAGSTKVDLRGPQNCCGRCIHYGPKNRCYDPPGEVGGLVLRPDGTVFAAGAVPDGEEVAHTSIYNPATNKWTPGPDFPGGDQAYDTSLTVLPDGMVLVEGASGYIYEADNTTMTRVGYGGGNMTNLPTGEILIGGSEVYQGTGHPQKSWRPKITDFPASVTRGQTYKISGAQFNGLTQGASLGDEFDSHSNYPLVRIANDDTGHVFYARTHDHSTMAVATGRKTVFTNFDVPSDMETGASKLEVVANGIPSEPVDITVN